MALNVKAAMLVCSGFITGMCWLVSRAELPMDSTTQPTAARAGAPLEDLAALPIDDPPPPPLEPETVNLAFERENPFERQTEANIAAGERIFASLIPPAKERMSLPPLVRPADDTVRLVSATPAETIIAPLAEEAAAQELANKSQRPTPAPAVARVGKDAPAIVSAPVERMRQYTVRKGDWLTKVVRKEMGTTDQRAVELLLAANPELVRRPNKLKIGETLNIPNAAALKLVMAGKTPAQALAKRNETKPAAQPVAVVVDTPKPQTPRWQWYTVKQQDSLAGIARRYLNDAERWREIAEINELRNPNKLPVGLKLRLPNAGSPPRG